MPAPTPLPLRRAMIRRAQQGQSPEMIARALGVPVRTVRHLLHRLQGSEQPADLAPCYQRTPLPDEGSRHPLYPETLALRRQHPSWGAGFLRVVLYERYPDQSVPSERTLQRWIHSAGLGPAPAGRRPVSETPRAAQPHDTWQTDACEQVRLRSGQPVSWLRMIDECSGAVLWTKVFPPREVAHRRAHPGAGRVPPGVPALGTTGHDAGGQRWPVGLRWRLAAGPGVVADRLRHSRPLQRPALSDAERRGGAFPGDREALGRPWQLRHARGVATESALRRPGATGGLPKHRGTKSGR